MEDLEARLARIESRLDALEARRAGVPRQPVPPVYRTVEVAEPAPQEAPDLETLLASRWLPRAGALAIVAAIAYLVALGLQRGWITPAMVVLGIALACIGVIALGMRLRNEREAFGHVLVGLGAGGLYVDAVGAHLYQNVIGSETMVFACLAISLASLGYGFWRALPAFLGIGLSGGIIAALMPLAKGGTATAAGLLILVAVPAFTVAAKRRWPAAVAASWLACMVATVPILTASGPIAVRLMPLDILLVLAVSAWALAAEKFPKSDPQGAFPLAACAIAGVTALSFFSGFDGALHLVDLGLAVAAPGLIFRRTETGMRVFLSGVGIAACLAPFGLPNHGPDVTLALLALVGALTTWRKPTLAPLVAVEAALSLAAYLYNWAANRTLTAPQEAALIALLTGAAIAAAAVLDRAEGRIASGVVVWGLATRLAIIGLGLPTNASITVAWIAVCAALLAIGFIRRLPELRQLGLGVAALTAAKVVLIDLSGLDAALKAVLLLSLGVVLLAGGYAYVRTDRLKGNLRE